MFGYAFAESGSPALFSLSYSWFSILATSILLYICGMVCDNFSNEYQFLNVPSHLPTALFFILSNFIDRSHSIDFWCLILVLSLIGFRELIRAYQNLKPEPHYFNVGFLLGFSSIVFTEYLFFLFAIFTCVLLLSNFRFHYFTLVVIAFVMPWVIWFTILFFSDNLIWFPEHFNNILPKQFDGFVEQIASLNYSFYWLSLLSLVSLPFWVSRGRYLDGYQAPILQVSSSFLLFGFAIIFLFFHSYSTILLLLILALVFLLSYLFYYSNLFLANVLFIITLLAGVVYPFIKNIYFIL